MKNILSALLAIYLIFSIANAHATLIAFNGIIGEEGAIVDMDVAPIPEGNPGTEGVSVEAAEEALVWQTLASFKISSPYMYGFKLTANLVNAGWSLNSAGTSQDANYNTFTQFRLYSDDTSNYTGTTSMSLLPVWESMDTLPKTFESGAQSTP